MSNVNGDIKVFGVDRGHQKSLGWTRMKWSPPLFSIALPHYQAPPQANAADTVTRTNEIPTGIAISRDGTQLYVALNLSNRLAELDATNGAILRFWYVGVAPFDVVLTGRKIYVSNWGGRQPGQNSVTGPAGDGTFVRVDDRSIANEGSVTVLCLDDPNRETEILTGLHTCAMALSPNGKYLAVANAGSDTVTVLDTHTDKIVETICTRQNPGDLFGAQPDALAFDKSGRRLFACNGTQNAVAEVQFKPGDSTLLGLIPVGWFPGAIAFDARRNQICVGNLKNITTTKQQPLAGLGLVPGFNTKEYSGSLSFVPVPSAKQLAKYTHTALADLRYPLMTQAKLPARPNQLPQPVPERVGEPSVFQHVLYIIKENRTYDQG